MHWVLPAAARGNGRTSGCGEIARSGGATEAARPAVHLEPDLAAAVGAVAPPTARELREQPQPEALGPDGLRVEAVALVGHLDARVVLGEAREEDDALVAPQAGVADGVAD